MMKNRVLLKDIAEKLNLTANTVSRALHDKADISEKTKENVRRVAEELGYIPDSVASSMRTASTKTIAVLFDNLLNPYFMIMANQIQKHLMEIGYEMMIFTVTSTEAILPMDVLKKMISRRVDGVISFLRPSFEVAEYANKIHLPIFILGREADDLNIDSIFTNDVQGGGLMGEYLYQKGYKHVGYLGGPKDILCNVKRAEGFQKYYDERGIEVRTTYSSWDEKSVYENLESLVNQGVDAIFCFNDNIAYSAILYLKEHYPHHKPIEVTGYDNIAGSLQLPIPIATIGTNIEKMISICIEQFMKRIDNFNLPLFVQSNETFLIIHE